jgi:hypothetical protein
MKMTEHTLQIDASTALRTYIELSRQAYLARERNGPVSVIRQAENLERQHQARMVEMFAELNGWYRVDGMNFRPKDIGHQRGRTWLEHRESFFKDRDDSHTELVSCSVFDHGLWFRQKLGGRRWRNIAIVGQPYGEWGWELLEQQCSHHGLKWLLAPNPKASFHYPGATLFLVVTLPEIDVQWLPEQTEQISFPAIYGPRRSPADVKTPA